MKQIFFHASKGPIVDDVPAPVCHDNGVLVRVQFSLISSGTETRAGGLGEKEESIPKKVLKNVGLAQKVAKKIAIDGLKRTLEVIDMVRNRTNPVGYSAAGVVIELGKNVKDIAIGDKVVCGGMGYANHAEIIYTPRNLLCPLPDNVTAKEGCFTIVASVGLQGVRQTHVSFGDNVAVIGLGLIGLLSVQILKAAGARVIGFDLDQKRIDLAKRLGIDQAFNLKDVDPVAENLKFTNNIGADCVLLVAQTNSSEPVNLAMRLARVKGRIVAVGASGFHIEETESFFSKELDFVASHAYGPGRYDAQYEEHGIDYPIGYVRWTLNRNMGEFVRLLAEKKVDVIPLIDYEYPIEKIAEAYAHFDAGRERPVGIVLKYTDEIGQKLQRKYIIKDSTGKQGDLNGAIIGCGQWSLMHHVPNIATAPDVNLKAVTGKTGSKIKQVAEKYRIEYYTTDYQEVLQDPQIDFVIIATRNNSHYQIAKEAVEAGKHVLLEKPMAMTREEMLDLATAVEKSSVHFGVGFNRRYSPFAREIKKTLSADKGPMMILYRINGGPHAKGHWAQDPIEGGGLIIGECCHYFDFFNFIIDKPLIDTKVINIPTNKVNVFNNHDNLVVSCRYADNSIANLIYSSLGTEALEKEYIELYHNGDVVINNDYKLLRFYGSRTDTIDIRQDKGMKSELEEFIKRLQGKPSNFISLADSVHATELCFDVIDAINRAKE